MARGRSISLALFLLLAGWTRLAGQGAGAPAPKAGLQVAPTRVVFDNRRRTTTVSITNTGGAQGHYRLSLMRLEMDDNGGCTEQPLERGSAHAELQDMLLFAPREVTLNPLESQTVRIQVRKPENLAPGEYRSHLLFRAVPPAEAPSTATGEMRVQLRPVFGVSIPLIVRHGDLTGAAKLAGLELVPVKSGDPAGAKPSLRVRIDRSGNASVFGNLTVTFVPAAGGKLTVVGIVNGLAVYTPNAYRTVEISLNVPPGMELRHGSLRVRYGKSETAADVLAEAALALP